MHWLSVSATFFGTGHEAVANVVAGSIPMSAREIIDERICIPHMAQKQIPKTDKLLRPYHSWLAYQNHGMLAGDCSDRKKAPATSETRPCYSWLARRKNDLLAGDDGDIAQPSTIPYADSYNMGSKILLFTSSSCSPSTSLRRWPGREVTNGISGSHQSANTMVPPAIRKTSSPCTPATKKEHLPRTVMTRSSNDLL